MTDKPIATATVETQNSGKYVRQLLKHWSHNLEVSERPDGGSIVFPKNARGADWPGDATVDFRAEQDAILCRIEASSEGQLKAMEGAVARHLDRFAFREGPLNYQWNRSTT